MPTRIRREDAWGVGVGVALALGLVLMILILPQDYPDGEWDASTELAFGLAIAGVGLLLWMVGQPAGGRAAECSARRGEEPPSTEGWSQTSAPAAFTRVGRLSAGHCEMSTTRSASKARRRGWSLSTPQRAWITVFATPDSPPPPRLFRPPTPRLARSRKSNKRWRSTAITTGACPCVPLTRSRTPRIDTFELRLRGEAVTPNSARRCQITPSEREIHRLVSA